jgi:hypothetical protein
VLLVKRLKLSLAVAEVILSLARCLVGLNAEKDSCKSGNVSKIGVCPPPPPHFPQKCL